MKDDDPLISKLEEEIDKKTYKLNLDQILSSSISNKVIIDSSAMKKLKAYSLVLKDLVGTDYECMGYLISPPDSYLVWDAVLCDKQEVTEGFGQGFGAKKTADKIHKDGFKIIGFWHSHAGHGFVDPSSIDFGADRDLFSSNKVELYSTFDTPNINLSEGKNGTTYLVEDYAHLNNQRSLFYLDEGGEPHVEKQRLTILKFIYNMIINNKGQNKARLMYKVLEDNKEYGDYKHFFIDIDDQKQFNPNINCTYKDVAEEILEKVTIKKNRKNIKLKEDINIRKKFDSIKSNLEKNRIKNNNLSEPVNLGQE